VFSSLRKEYTVYESQCEGTGRPRPEENPISGLVLDRIIYIIVNSVYNNIICYAIRVIIIICHPYDATIETPRIVQQRQFIFSRVQLFFKNDFNSWAMAPRLKVIIFILY